MIKIIKPSKKPVYEKPKKRKYVVTCKKCGCVFECEDEDINHVQFSNSGKHRFWVNCPENSTHVLLLDVELFGIVKEYGEPDLKYAKCIIKEEE